MILYSKNGDFIGIGKDELSFMGFEDIDEFKSLHQDVADLFVNKPGYIFKFQNFSWIDYALHSGAPKKSVMLKLKNGNEIEVYIKIKEIYLIDTHDSQNLYYSVEFTNNSVIQKNNLSTPVQETVISLETPNNKEPEQTTTLPELGGLKITEDFSEVNLHQDTRLKIENDIYDIEDDYEPKNIETEDFKEEIEKPTIQENLDKVPKFDMKLKIDDDVFKAEPSIKSPVYNEPVVIQRDNKNISNFIVEDYEKEDDFSKNNAEIGKEVKVQFDLADCADRLGLELNLIAQIVTEYLEDIDATLPIVKKDINEDNSEELANNIYQLKGISDNLQVDFISTQLTKIMHSESKNKKLENLATLEIMISQLKGELI